MKFLLSLALLLCLTCVTRGEEVSTFPAVEYWAENTPVEFATDKEASPASRVSHTVDTLPLIVTEPVSLSCDGKTYSLAREGLYRIRVASSPKVVRQAILYRGDVWRFAGHLSRVYVYGSRHQHEPQTRWDERVRNGEPLSVQCGFLAQFIQRHLAEQKIPARLVGCVNGNAWHQFDDGHALMELQDEVEHRWVLYDPTLGARFRSNGRLLNLLEMTQRYRQNQRVDKMEFVNASADKLDPLTDFEALYGPSLKDKQKLAAHMNHFKPLFKNDVEAIHLWYGRVMQIPLIGNTFAPGNDAEDALLRTLPCWKNLERLTVQQFRDRFYEKPAAKAK